MGRVVSPGFHDRVYEVVRRVPPGRVATYGDVACALGARSVARHVGYALASLPPDRADVPWHRVVNAKGRLSFRSHGDRSTDQILLLTSEGVPVDATGRIEDFAALRFPLEEV